MLEKEQINYNDSDNWLTDFQRRHLLKNLSTESRPEYRQRIEIMLRADSGQSQTQICKELGCSHETARYWMTIAQSGQAHMWQQHPIGRPKRINEKYLEALKELVSNDPRHYGYPFRTWTAEWLSKHLAKHLKIQCSARHVNRLLQQMNLSTKPKKIERTAEVNISSKNARIVIGNLSPSEE